MSVKVPTRFVMVEGEAFCRAVFGEDGHDVRLLFRREFVFTTMVAVIWSATSAEVIADRAACCSP